MQSQRHDGITAEIKLNIVECYSKSGNLTTAAQLNNVEPRLVRYHVQHDPAFKLALDEARQQLCDRAEGFVTEYMARPGNVIDRMAFLRAYRPGVWNPQANIQVTHTVEVVKRLSEKLPEYTETTLEPGSGPEPGAANGNV